MNREIKFRAWFKPEKRMHTVNTISFNEGWIDATKYNGDIEDFELMQFTGLNDINGNEVYEGDIIKNTDTGETSLVFWNTEKVQFCVRYDNDHQDIYPLHRPIGNLYCVVGNMHEHPHLISQPL